MKILFNKKVTTESLMTLHMADNVNVSKQKKKDKNSERNWCITKLYVLEANIRKIQVLPIRTIIGDFSW